MSHIATFEEDTGLGLTLANFLDHYHIDARSIYKFDSFFRLCARADVIDEFEEPIWNDNEVRSNLSSSADSPVMLSELKVLLKYNYNRIDFIDETVDLIFDCPLDLHCTYTRDQLLVAMDFMKPSTVREGVK